MSTPLNNNVPPAEIAAYDVGQTEVEEPISKKKKETTGSISSKATRAKTAQASQTTEASTLTPAPDINYKFLGAKGVYNPDVFDNEMRHPTISPAIPMPPGEIRAAINALKKDIGHLLPGLSASYYAVMVNVASQALENPEYNTTDWIHAKIKADLGEDPEISIQMAEALALLIANMATGSSSHVYHPHKSASPTSNESNQDHDHETHQDSHHLKTTRHYKDPKSDPVLQKAEEKGEVVIEVVKGKQVITILPSATQEVRNRARVQDEINKGRILVDELKKQLILNDQMVKDARSRKQLNHLIKTETVQNRSYQDFSHVGKEYIQLREAFLTQRISDTQSKLGTNAKSSGISRGQLSPQARKELEHLLNTDKFELHSIKNPKNTSRVATRVADSSQEKESVHDWARRSSKDWAEQEIKAQSSFTPDPDALQQILHGWDDFHHLRSATVHA